jgi:hypothetical protein
MARSAFVIIMALFTVAGCGKVGHTLGPGRTTGHILIRPLQSPDTALLKETSFYAEYLLESKNNFERVAVFIEPLKTPAAIILNPGVYVSGQTGAETIGTLIHRFAPLRLHTIRASTGNHLGYALLRPGETLRTTFVRKGRYWLELSRK